MRFETYSERLLSEQDRGRDGPKMREFHKSMSTMSLLDNAPQPAKYSRRWIWKEWSHTGADLKSDYIYLLGSSDKYVKIGVANDPIRRVAELTWSLQRRIFIIAMWMHPKAYEVEHVCHLQLRPFQKKFDREWFKVTPAVAVAAITEAMLKNV